MGGFVAILEAGDCAIDRRLLQSLMDIPPFDGGRVAIWTAGDVGLCATALRSPLAAPPQLASRDGLVVVMDGRLDDRVALVRRLATGPERMLDTASDVELMLTAYERWGSDCARHLLGDFSFCIWDSHRRELFCGRDHLGIKPLYYARLGATLVVSNVLRSIRRHPRVSARLDDYAIGDVLLIGACMHPSRTSFADIARVPPAHTLTCSMGTRTERVDCYWSLVADTELRVRDRREYVDRYLSVLDTVVRDRVRDAPAGVLLSGGLDSSSVAAASAQIVGRDAAPNLLRAYTFVYDSVAEDEERHYSSLVANHLRIGIEHHPVDHYGWFERWNSGLLPPEPSTEPMTAMTSDLLERVARHSSVALTGDGGDPAWLPSTLLWLLRSRSPHRLIGDFVRAFVHTQSLPPVGIRSVIRQWFSRRTEAHVPIWLSDAFVRRCALHERSVMLSARRGRDEGPRGPAARAMTDPWWTSMFETYDPGATQRPVELRYPLFDVRFIAFALSLPTYPWCVNKHIVRLAMRGRLPDDICVRPKSPLQVDALRTHGPWTATRIAAAIQDAPELEAYIDLHRFSAHVREDRVMTDQEPGTWAVAALATWLCCAASPKVTA